MVRTGTMVWPGSDAAVFRVREANKILAATTDCNSLYCGLDPREGARIAVAEAARNLTCSGAKPLAVTDNLNFGNPYKPEIFWQLREAVEGAAEACRTFNTPVIGGNVSLYNESPAGAVDPTPTIAMVGLVEDEKYVTTQYFKNPGDMIFLLGPERAGYDLGASHFLKVCLGLKEGLPPRLDIKLELTVQNVTRDLIRAGLLKSAHDCSEGGLAVALAECCFNPDHLLGAELDCSRLSMGDLSAAHRATATLFNETQSRIVISIAPENETALSNLLRDHDVPFQKLGTVDREKLSIRVNEEVFSWLITDLYDDWFNSIRNIIEDSQRAPDSL
jgi:phosphoribosylformylglycinamidine synthase